MVSIACENLSFQAGSDRSILSAIDCRFQQGELTVITGPSASGKTALARVFCGLDKPSGGKITKGYRRWLIQQDSGNGFLTQTIRDEISIGINTAKGKRENLLKRYEEALDWAGLREREAENLDRLSTSERRLVSIAAAWAARPDFFFFDEPCAGLDQALVRKILELQLSLVKQGFGVIVVCYDIERILAHADRLILMKQGRIIADALPERVLPFLESHGVRKPNLKLPEMTWLGS